VRNGAGLVLALERSDVAGSWQAPQGGIEAGESPEQAASRELFEEAGIRWEEASRVSQHPEWLTYELPPSARSAKTGLGQTQRWFLVDYDGPIDESLVRQGKEFVDYQWMPMTTLIASTWPPRQRVYLQLLQHWQTQLVDGVDR